MKITILRAELIDSLLQIQIPRPEKKLDSQLSASLGHRPLIAPFTTIACFQGSQVDNHRHPLPQGKRPSTGGLLTHRRPVSMRVSRSVYAGLPLTGTIPNLTRGLPPKQRIRDVSKVIAVASAKGGVGKSTIAGKSIHQSHGFGLYF